jgi:protein-tyrosine phosphatase
VSRSATLVIAFIMRENNWKYNEAHKFVKSKRSIISPNPGFYNQLRCYEIKLGLTNEEEIDEMTKNKKYDEKVSFSFEDF